MPTTGILFCLSLLVFSGSDGQAKEINLRYATVFPPVHKITLPGEEWGKEVEKRTGGRVKVSSFPGGNFVAMMCLTCADIVLRLFRMPILGTWEIVGFLGAVLAGFALAQTTVQRGHVAVQVIVKKISPRIQAIVFLVTHVFSLLLFGLLAVESLRYGHAVQISREVSSTIEIPFFPLLYGIAFCSFIVFVVLFIDLLLVITRKEEAWFGWPD